MRPPRGVDDPTDAHHGPEGLAAFALRRRPRLSWRDAAGEHAVSLDGRVVVGSAATVDVVVADPTVSRLHAEFELRDGALWVRDLGSRNGTFVEGVLVGSARVPDGGRVRLGATEIRAHDEPRPVAVELWSSGRFGPLIGRSEVMRELFARLARVAPTPSTVLVQGETGTGKELVARALHEASPRRGGPFVVVDCGALPEKLLEAELFGHARGAFTGAAEARAGAIESAEGGTVFLDEVGELPLAMQPKLLRVLESRAVRRLGESSHRAVDVRFVAATHRDLRTMVNERAFREDLYFRLAVVPVTLPPLRARREDVADLVAHFLPASALGAIRPEIVRELESRPWLGNVRELRNFVERALALGSDEALAMVPPAPPPAGATGPDAFPPVPVDRPFQPLREQWNDHLERSYFRQLLEIHRHNISAVARAAGLDRTWVHKLIRKHGL